MNTKKFFMLLMAVLLSSLSVHAQSNDPLKGDVNEDGVVDVGDINAIIEIMKNGGGTGGEYYWYIGITAPTSLSQASVVSSYEDGKFVNPSMDEKNWVYILTNADKIVNFYDPAFPQQATTKNEDTTSIPGYKITSTGVRIAKGGEVLYRISDEDEVPQPTAN